MPRKANKKATAQSTQILLGLAEQPRKMVVNVVIDFNDCQRLSQLCYKVNPDPQIESGLKIGEVPALVDSGANVTAPVLLSLQFLKTVMPTNQSQPFLSNDWQAVSRADGRDNLAIVGRLRWTVDAGGRGDHLEQALAAGRGGPLLPHQGSLHQIGRVGQDGDLVHQE